MKTPIERAPVIGTKILTPLFACCTALAYKNASSTPDKRSRATDSEVSA